MEAKAEKLPLNAQELMFLRRRVEELAHQTGVTPKWLSAYQRLADALSALEDLAERDPDYDEYLMSQRTSTSPAKAVEEAAAGITAAASKPSK